MPHLELYDGTSVRDLVIAVAVGVVGSLRMSELSASAQRVYTQGTVPLKELQRKFGFEPDRVVEMAKEVLGKNEKR